MPDDISRFREWIDIHHAFPWYIDTKHLLHEIENNSGLTDGSIILLFAAMINLWAPAGIMNAVSSMIWIRQTFTALII